MLEIFSITNSEFITDFKGSDDPFLLIEYDKQSKRLTLSSQFFGTEYPLYMVIDNDLLYLCDSLIKLKNALNKSFKLNIDMLPFFFYNGFLPGKHTLIQGVYKLPPRKCLVVENGKFHIDPLELAIPDKQDEMSDLCRAYDDALRNAILKNAPHGDTFNLALSGGYDSNLLLHMVRSLYPDIKVNCFSVGGTVGTDETGVASSIARMYDNVSFYSTMVSPETMNDFDDIVYRLEGCAYERGIFLQYELAKMLHEHGCDHIICGECADQVFHAASYEPSNEGRFLYGYMETPFEMASYVVLKKSTVMLRTFGITSIYPYLDADVIKVGALTKSINGTDKAFHKSQCKRHLPTQIYNKLSKVGGSTQLLPLIDKSVDYETLCQDFAYYEPSFRYTKKYPREESIMDYYLSLRYIESFERQFCDEKQ